MIYKGSGLLAVVKFGSFFTPSPPPSPVSNLSNLSQASCVSPVELTEGREGGGRGRRGAESYDRRKAWSSESQSILSEATL
jgi:hypothetical protein